MFEYNNQLRKLKCRTLELQDKFMIKIKNGNIKSILKKVLMIKSLERGGKWDYYYSFYSLSTYCYTFLELLYSIWWHCDYNRSIISGDCIEKRRNNIKTCINIYAHYKFKNIYVFFSN